MAGCRDLSLWYQGRCCPQVTVGVVSVTNKLTGSFRPPARLSAILFALFYGGELPSVQSFLGTVFLSGNYWGLVIAHVAVGGLLAALRLTP
jgi:hypothetical protein